MLVTASHAQNDNNALAAAPEIKQTVNRLSGHWKFQGADTESQAKEPSKVALTIDCRPTALGAAVVCDFRGNVADSGSVEIVLFDIRDADPINFILFEAEKVSYHFSQLDNPYFSKKYLESKSDATAATPNSQPSTTPEEPPAPSA